MRDETKEAMRLFIGCRCYTVANLERDYLAEVTGYSDDRWEAPQRAARLAAGQHWAATLAEIERVKRLYQVGVKKSRNEEG